MVKILLLNNIELQTLNNDKGNVIYNTDKDFLYLNNGNGFKKILSLDNNNRIGINTDIPQNTLDINNSTGKCLRLLYNNNLGTNLNYCDLLVSSSGNLQINSSGLTNEIHSSNNLNIMGHNGINIGLQLNSILVTANANELNYNDLTFGVGIGEANKALILDSNKDISSIRNISASSLTLINPLTEINGGTGYNTYTKGDILVASTTTKFEKLNISLNNGDFLISDNNTITGVKWSSNIFDNYYDLGLPIWISNTEYIIPYFRAQNKLNNSMIKIDTNNINLLTTGLNGIAQSNNLNGTIYPNPLSTTIIGTSTTFLSDFLVNDILFINNNNYKKITSITSNTELVIDSSFTLLNIWSLVGATLSTTQSRYGLRSLNINNVTNSYANIIPGSNITFNSTLNNWTIEFYFYLNVSNVNMTLCYSNIANSFLLRYNRNNNQLTISLGQGVSFNIANASRITPIINATTWYHFAIVYNNTDYRCFINGTLGLTIANSTKITNTAFNNLRFGSNATIYNGFIDEIRISDISRYSTTFTALNNPFIKDENTVALNHFEESTISASDECVNNIQFNYKRNGVYYSNTILHCYALNHQTTPGYIMSNRSIISDLVDLPIGYTNSNARKIPLFIPIQNNNIPYSVFASSKNFYNIIPFYTITANSTNTIINTFALNNIIPSNCKKIQLLITHTHVGTSSCGIIIGADSSLYTTYLTVATAGNTYGSYDIPILSNLSIDARLSAVASTTSYTLNITGFYLDNDF